MGTITKFDTSHEDLIHDIAYDYYGKRLVTCSSDQRLKVWDFVEREQVAVWELNDSWKAHDSSILKAIWAHPEYGQVIASCSLDRLVKIWEEQPSGLSIQEYARRHILTLLRGSISEPKNSQKRWTERFRLVESRSAVLDIAFAPMQGALRLATCSADGIVRIYEAIEPTNLAQWSQMEEFEISQSDDRSISSSTQPPQLPQQPMHTHSSSSSVSSVTSHALSTPGLDAPGNAGPFPGITSAGNNAATAGQNVSPSSQANTLMQNAPSSISRQGGGGGAASTAAAAFDADSGYCIDWCPNRTATPLMVVGLGKEIGARIFRHDGHSRWYPGEFLPGHEQEVHDVSWAPSMAR